MRWREVTKVIGLTGPIGAGKSEVAKILKRHGAFVINVDEVAHTLYKPQEPVWQELVKTFGSKILRRGGEINREKLGEIVFSDRKKLQELNRIVHPYLKEAIVKEIEDHRLKTKDQRPIVINAAVLKEIGLVDYVDEVWVVMASQEKRLKRLVRSGIPREEALKRMRVQSSPSEYLKIADKVIKNEGGLKDLERQVLHLK